MNNCLSVLRTEHRWSQQDLAERVGVSRETVNAIETGKYNPSLPLAVALSEVLQKSIEEVFTTDPDAQATSS